MAKGPWDMAELGPPPEAAPAEGFGTRGCQGTWLAGPPFRGKPTRVFAWVGLPDAPAGRRVPGIVLVHGGGGSAFARWVRQWNRRGYAAIAMDTCGCLPVVGRIGRGYRHEAPGPDGCGGFGQLDWPARDQWPYHAVASVILSHSLLRSLPQVDARRVGLLGISWGGWLASIAASVDPRFRFAACVYGCGFLREGASPLYLNPRRRLGGRAMARWLARWDPGHFLPACRTPLLWIAGTNDLAFSLGSRRLSARAAPGTRHLSVRIGWDHNYQAPWGSGEIADFADERVGRGVPPLARVGPPVPAASGMAGASVSARCEPATAEVCYTCDGGAWQQRLWRSLPATLTPARRRVRATVPAAATAWFFNVTDARGRVASSEHAEAPGPAPRPGARGR